MRRGPAHGQRRARGHGLLSLRIVPELVGEPRQCLHPLETREREDHTGGEQHRHVQQDAEQLSQMVQDLRRPPLHRASRHGPRRRLCGGHPERPLPGGRPRQLSGDEAANAGRVADDEGFPQGNRRLRHHRRGIPRSARRRPVRAGGRPDSGGRDFTLRPVSPSPVARHAPAASPRPGSPPRGAAHRR